MVNIEDKIDSIDMLLRHYTLFGDSVDIYSNMNIKNIYLGRKVNKYKLKFDSDIDNIFEKFEIVAK